MKRKDGIGYWGLLVAALGLGAVAWLWWQAGNIPAENHPVAPKSRKVSASPKPVVRPAIRKETAPLPPIQPTPVPHANAPVLPPVTNSFASPPSTNLYPRPVRDLFEAQVALGRQGISCGSIDGRQGTQTRAALRAFQQQEHLGRSGELDAHTRAKLWLLSAPCITYNVTSNDLARLQPLSASWLGKSQQSALEYETLLELVAEKSQSHPRLIRRLNPGVDWAHVAVGTALVLPEAAYPGPQGKAVFVTVHLAERTLEAFDAQSNLVAHFPCSIAKVAEKRPVGELHVIGIAPHPNYTFNPELFPESAEAQELKARLILPPGPNNPVGVAWIGLDRPGYGIHGTPQPEQIGRTESHGCFRLANWNADYLLHLVTVGTPVYVEP